MNTPVNFELAKLLKEKGLKLGSKSSYFEPTEDYIYDGDEKHPESYKKGEVKFYAGFYYANGERDDMFEAPTIAETVMWLYENHEIWIQVFIFYKTFAWKVQDVNTLVITCLYAQQDKGYKAPTEAYQEAIKYTLNKLL